MERLRNEELSCKPATSSSLWLFGFATLSATTADLLMQILLSTMLRIYDSRKDNFCCRTLLRRLSAEIVDKFSASPSEMLGKVIQSL